jgi:hypothetical protein
MKTSNIILSFLLVLSLAGCAGVSGYQNLSPEVAAIAAKDNKAVFQCLDIPTSGWVGGGVAKVRVMVVDSGTVRYGQFRAASCDDISFTNDNKPAVSPSTPIQVAVPIQVVPRVSP